MDVILSPLLLVVDLGHVTNDIFFAVVDIAASGTLVRLDPRSDVELQVLQEGDATVEDLVAVETLEVELVVSCLVVLVPQLVSKSLSALVAKDFILDFQVNYEPKVFLILF